MAGRRRFAWIWKLGLALLVLLVLAGAGYYELVRFAMHD